MRRVKPNSRRIALRLASEISSGQWQHGDTLPRTRGLARQFGVSKGVARRALEMLVELEMAEIRRERGKLRHVVVMQRWRARKGKRRLPPRRAERASSPARIRRAHRRPSTVSIRASVAVSAGGPR